MALVGGPDDTPAAFQDLAAFLGADFNLYRFVPPEEASLAGVAVALAAALKDTPGQIDLCTLGAGALTVRACLGGPDAGRLRVRRLMMVAPPNHGIDLARLRLVLEFSEAFSNAQGGDPLLRAALLVRIQAVPAGIAADLKPGSDFLTALAGRSLPAETACAIIAGDTALIAQEQQAFMLQWLDERLCRGAGDPFVAMARERLRTGLKDAEEIVHGRGDLVVPLESARLEGVAFHVVHRNHLDIMTGDDTNPAFGIIREFLAAPVPEPAPIGGESQDK